MKIIVTVQVNVDLVLLKQIIQFQERGYTPGLLITRSDLFHSQLSIPLLWPSVI